MGKKYIQWVGILMAVGLSTVVVAQEGLIDAFPFGENNIKLERIAQPGTPFDKVGRKFAVLGFESGSFEAWAYPLKLLRKFEFSFFLASSTRPIHGSDIVRWIEVTPEVTSLTFTYQSFTVKAHYITPTDEPGSLILLAVDATEPLSVVCSFLPVLQPMWPAGMGGQYAYWDNELKAYVISEPKRRHHGIIGSPAAVGLSYTPAHMLSDVSNEFKIDIAHPEKLKGKFIPIVMAGGQGKREEVIDLYKKLGRDPESTYQRTVQHYRRLRGSTLQIKTPEPEINLAFEWAKVAYDNLVVDNPDLGRGLVAGLAASGTSGRPGFGWFFGGDTYINALSMNSYCEYKTVKEVLEFMTQFQRDDGKMAHEISQAAGYIDWFGEYPYGYIHGDTSPYFIVAVHDYVKMSGDVDFVKRHWRTLQRAYEWSLSTDANGDGLMDNRKAGLGALEYGKLTGGIATDIYVGAVWVKAAQAMRVLAEHAEKKAYAKKVEKHAKKAEESFHERFWDGESQFYAYGFSEEGEHVKEFSPWSAVGLMWELGDPERSKTTLRCLGSSELTTDWGVRSISNKSVYYEPLNYNYGAVWPFLNSWVATAQFKHHFLHQGYCTLMSTIGHVFNNQLGAVGEVFSGSLHTWPQESVPHQGFSTAGTVLPLVRGLLGLEGDALEKRVWFSPHFPADWGEVFIDHYRIGSSVFSFRVNRSRDKIVFIIVAENGEGYILGLAPGLGVGNEIQSVKVGNQIIPFESVESLGIVQPRFQIPIENGTHRIEVSFQPTAEILPLLTRSKVGDGDRGLKIVSLGRSAGELIIDCEGMSGETYSLKTVNSEHIRKVEGGELGENTIVISFPSEGEGEFVKKRVKITTR